MRKYNLLIILSVCLYVMCAISGNLVLEKSKKDSENQYLVEINRIYNEYIQSETWDTSGYEYVKDVAFLDAENENIKEIETFYKKDNNYQIEIRPMMKDGKISGYLRFDYIRTESNLTAVQMKIQFLFLMIELGALIVLFYLKYQLVKPFQKISEIPYELSKGHLKNIVKEDKNKFFGKFLWGLSLLKDTLDISKKRELELEKEKKEILLSLTHDIKTPVNTIKLYSKALEENLYKDEEKTDIYKKIQVKTNEIEKYVEEIMKHSREDILEIKINEGEFYLHDLMEKVIETYSEKCKLLMIDFQVESYVNRILYGDLDRSYEVIENVMENAMKYGDGRKITISFYEEEYHQCIKIFNTGIVVSDTDFNHIFESFYRGSGLGSGSRAQIRGNGLGLYICKTIMRKMQGDIFAVKEKDGMSFVLVFK